eukprot:4677516-Amphidinium_carterae.1
MEGRVRAVLLHSWHTSPQGWISPVLDHPVPIPTSHIEVQRWLWSSFITPGPAWERHSLECWLRQCQPSLQERSSHQSLPICMEIWTAATYVKAVVRAQPHPMMTATSVERNKLVTSLGLLAALLCRPQIQTCFLEGTLWLS